MKSSEYFFVIIFFFWGRWTESLKNFKNFINGKYYSGFLIKNKIKKKKSKQDEKKKIRKL